SWKELVLITEMVLTELTGGVSHCLKRGGDCRRLRWNSNGRACLTDGRQAGADRQFAGDEVGASRRAARFGIVIREQHALGSQAIEVRRPPGHQAAMISADIP